MIRVLVLAAIALASASVALAQQPAPAPDAASTPSASHVPLKKRFHAPKLRKGATAASSPLASPFKQGGE